MTAHPPSPPEAAPYRKAVLFCPDCGYESPASGDWIVQIEGERETYVCPECGATIVTRLRSEPICC